MKKTTLAMLILCACLALPAQAGFEDGLAAYKRGDYATALKEWQPLAEAGNADAQYNLGLMYYNGRGVPQDHREAVKWYRLAAEQGYALAQYNLGVMYVNGRGVPQDDKESVKWFRLAAEQGYALAQNNLGVMYVNGRGVPQDKVLAYALFNLAAASDPSYNKAISNRNAIAKEMTPREIEAGQALTMELAQPGNFGKALDAYLKADKASAPKAGNVAKAPTASAADDPFPPRPEKVPGQQQSALQKQAARQDGYQDTTGMQMGFNFTPFTFSPHEAASHMLHRLWKDGSLRTAFANSLLEGGFKMEDVQRALDRYDNRMKNDTGFSVNKALSSMSLALADIGASGDPRDRALASQGLAAISGHYDQARQMRQQADAIFDRHDGNRQNINQKADEIYGKTKQDMERAERETDAATRRLMSREQIEAAAKNLVNAVLPFINKQRIEAGQNPLTPEQAQALVEQFKSALNVQDPDSLTPEAFKKWLDENRDSVLKTGT
jgi:hypothetical protein